jgi:hypothetical protein
MVSGSLVLPFVAVSERPLTGLEIQRGRLLAERNNSGDSFVHNAERDGRLALHQINETLSQYLKRLLHAGNECEDLTRRTNHKFDILRRLFSTTSSLNTWNFHINIK